jgi:hypothetical protein
MPNPSRRSPSRGGASRRGGGGGGGNAAYVVAGLFVVGIIVALVLVMSGGKKPPPPAPVEVPVVAPPPAAAPAKPKEPAALPYPPIDPSVVAAAREIARNLEAQSAKAQGFYDEAMKAKRAGDNATWQKKLEEADDILMAIQDDWNERVEGRIQPGNGYQEDQIANHYIGPESTKFNRAMSLLAAIRKSKTM